jgi:hypothetical protein
VTVEYYLQDEPEHSHEREAILAIARSLRSLVGPDHFYLLAANVRFWRRVQVDALALAAHAVVILELKAYGEPIYGHADDAWQVMPSGDKVHAGSYLNPYRQVAAKREALIKYLDRNRRRFLTGDRIRQLDGRWGHVSAAIVFSPFYHPDSYIVTPPESKPWLGIKGLNEIADFLFTRSSRQLDLRPEEMHRLAREAFGCKPWAGIHGLLQAVPSYGHLWLLDAEGNQTYAFPVVDGTTIGRSRDNDLVVPERSDRTSRHHARLAVVEGTIWLHDVRSERKPVGTFINNEPVAPGQKRPLHDGDHVTLGSFGHPDSCQLQFDGRTNIGPGPIPPTITKV